MRKTDQLKSIMSRRLFDETPLLNAIVLAAAAYFGVFYIFSYGLFMWLGERTWVRAFDSSIVYGICQAAGIVMTAAAYYMRYSHAFSKKSCPGDILRTCRLMLPGLILFAPAAAGFAIAGGLPNGIPNLGYIRSFLMDNIVIGIVFCWISVSYIMLHSKSERKIPYAVIIPGAIFAILRLPLTGQYTLIAIVSNILTMTFICIFYASVYIRGGSALVPIVFGIIYKQMWLFMNYSINGAVYDKLAFVRIFLEGLLAVYGLFIIRKSKREEILGLWHKKRSLDSVRQHRLFDRHTLICTLLMGIGFSYIFYCVFPYGLAERANYYGLIDGAGKDTLNPFRYIVSCLAAMCVYTWWFYPEYRQKPCREELLNAFRLSLPVMAGIAFIFVFDTVLAKNIMLRLPAGADVCNALISGICEEILWRKLAISTMMRRRKDEKRIPAAVIISGIGFGLCHMMNILHGLTPWKAAIQVIMTSLIGISYAAVYIRAGNVLPLIVCHTAYNIFAFQMSGASENAYGYSIWFAVMLAILLFAAYILQIVYAMYLIRRSKRGEILALWDGKWNIAAQTVRQSDVLPSDENITE